MTENIYILYEKCKINYYNTLKQEIVNIIKCHNKLGLLDNPNLCCIKSITSVDDLADKPEVHIVSYTKGPNNGQTNDDDVTIRKLKKSMYKYLFKKPKEDIKKTSEYCLENCINGANINGFNTLRDELFEDKKEVIHCVQDIKGEKYDFYFTFVDAAINDAWNCLPKI